MGDTFYELPADETARLVLVVRNLQHLRQIKPPKSHKSKIDFENHPCGPSDF
jgi:hypothetical protein